MFDVLILSRLSSGFLNVKYLKFRKLMLNLTSK